MSDGDSYQPSDGVSRRRFVSGTTAGGVVAFGGFTPTPTGDDDGFGSDSDSEAVNVDENDTIADADDISFDRAMPVATIDDLFLAYDTPDHPVIGTEVGFTAMSLNGIRSRSGRSELAENFAWGRFETDGDRLLSPLFDPVSWGNTDSVSLPSSFFEDRALVRLVGVQGADQRFYNRYGFPPFVWGVVGTDAVPRSGARLRVGGVVRYAGTEDDPYDLGDASGAYVDVAGLEQVGRTTTLSPETQSGSNATVTGLQYMAEPKLTTDRLDVSFSPQGNFPRPTGGSLVTLSGNVDSVDVASGPSGSASIEPSQQSIVVGDTRPDGWTEEGSDGEEETPFSNVVAVLDKSGSMDDRDTRSGDSRLTVAKEAANSLVNYVGSGNKLGLVAFDYDGQRIAPLQEVTESTREEMRSAVGRLSAGGDTSIGGGLQVALEMLKGTSGPKSIILMSDGKQNEPPHPREVLPDLKDLGVAIYSIGISSSAARNLLAELADETGGSMRYRPDPGDLRTLFQSFAISAQNWSKLATHRAELAEGETATGSATVDGSCDEVQFSLSYPGSRITLQPTKPDGTELSASSSGVSRRVGETNEIWTVENPDTGDWEFTVRGEQLDRPETATTEVSADSPISADLFITDTLYSQTGMYRVEAKVTNGQERYTGAEVTLTAELDGETTDISLRDDRGGPDPVADDGIYTGYFHPPETGEYTFSITVDGGEQDGLRRQFTRQLTVDRTIEEPVRPYRERQPVSEEGEESSSTSPGLLDQLADYGPVAAGGAALLLAIGALQQWLGDD